MDPMNTQGWAVEDFQGFRDPNTGELLYRPYRPTWARLHPNTKEGLAAAIEECRQHNERTHYCYGYHIAFYRIKDGQWVKGV